MAELDVHAGRCLCGEVRYEIRGPAVWSTICYCESCTRATGAIAVAWTGVEKAGFRLVSGELRLHQSTPGIWRGFCPRCGTAITYQKDPKVIKGARDDVYVTTRSLEDPGAFPPKDHVYYAERVSWLEIRDDRPHNAGTSEKYRNLQHLRLTGRE